MLAEEATSNFTHSLKPLGASMAFLWQTHGKFTRRKYFRLQAAHDRTAVTWRRWSWSGKEFACEGKHRSKRGAKNEAARQVLAFLIDAEAWP